MVGAPRPVVAADLGGISEVAAAMMLDSTPSISATVNEAYFMVDVTAATALDLAFSMGAILEDDTIAIADDLADSIGCAMEVDIS